MESSRLERPARSRSSGDFLKYARPPAISTAFSTAAIDCEMTISLAAIALTKACRKILRKLVDLGDELIPNAARSQQRHSQLPEHHIGQRFVSMCAVDALCPEPAYACSRASSAIPRYTLAIIGKNQRYTFMSAGERKGSPAGNRAPTARSLTSRFSSTRS